jgi:hypothetical protein
MLGFSIKERMEGFYALHPEKAFDKNNTMIFDIEWGTSNLLEWLNPKNENFMVSGLQGTIEIDGFTKPVPCWGTLSLDYFRTNTIQYIFEFDSMVKTKVGGFTKRYVYTGEKLNIKPWNLLTSHTTCFGTLVEKETGKLVARSVVYFKFKNLFSFLTSLKFI